MEEKDLALPIIKPIIIPLMFLAPLFIAVIILLAILYIDGSVKTDFCESRGQTYTGCLQPTQHCTIEVQDYEGNIYYEQGVRIPDKIK